MCCAAEQVAFVPNVLARSLLAGRSFSVALAGCGNWVPVALGALPELTSVDLCLEEVGRVAAGGLLAALAGKAPRASAGWRPAW